MVVSPPGGDGPLRAVDRLSVRVSDEPETAATLATDGTSVILRCCVRLLWLTAAQTAHRVAEGGKEHQLEDPEQRPARFIGGDAWGGNDGR